MNISRLFLFDFVTVKKIKTYIMAIFIFTIGALYYRDTNKDFVLSYNIATNIGISIALFTTIYVIYTYTTLDKIKMYLMLPFKKWEVFYAYIFAIYFSLILQRLSFVIVIIILFTKQPTLSVFYLIISSLLTTIINVNLLLSNNKKNYLTCVISVLSFIGLYYFLTYSLNFFVNFIIIILLFLINLLVCLFFIPKDLAISREVKVQSSNIHLNYFLRILLKEKIMMLNTIIILVVSLFYMILSPDNYIILNVVWCFSAINTPLFTVFSGDKELSRQEKMLPSNSNLMNGMYARFLSTYFVLINTYVVLLYCFVKNHLNIKLILLAIILIPIETIAIIYLEKHYIIQNWQTKQELWKNPRKYVLPVLVFLISFLFSFI